MNIGTYTKPTMQVPTSKHYTREHTLRLAFSLNIKNGFFYIVVLFGTGLR